MELALRPIVQVQRLGVLFSLRGLAQPKSVPDAVNNSTAKLSLTQKEIEVLRVAFLQYSAYIWDDVASFVRQYTYYLALSPRSLREYFASEVLKPSAPTWKCEIFANEGVNMEDAWEQGPFDGPRSIFTITQYRAIKSQVDIEIEKCWAEVATEMRISTGREMEIAVLKALYEQHHGGKSGAEQGIVNGIARMEV